MIDSIYVALSGMLGHERGLNVIGNNVTNMNTLGFRGSTVNFSDVFLGTMPNGVGGSSQEQRGIGGGVDSSHTTVDFKPGLPQNTGNDLDVFLQGDGFFIVQDESGAIRYTRAGSLDVVDDTLVLKGQKINVMTRDAGGQLQPITLKDMQINAGKATSKFSLTGNLLPNDTDFSIDSFDVFDKNGNKHTLKLAFTLHKHQSGDNPGAFDIWRLSATEQGQEIGTGDLQFLTSIPQHSPLKLQLALTGTDAIDVSVDFSGVQIQNLGQQDSSVTATAQDGFATGQITAKTFDEKGVLKLTYSNGQKADGPKLALAQVIDQAALVQVGDALFEYRGQQPVTIRDAGDDLKVAARQLEGSNVDLTTEFSQLILMQRGYQASSQVISTANDMLQELFDLRGRK
jgi:flagellar hook protein FlgE